MAFSEAEESKILKMAIFDFETLYLTKIDFTENLIGMKILKIPYSGHHNVEK